MEATKRNTKQIDMKFEVVLIEVSDVDRAKAFYNNLGWRLDADFITGDSRVIQFTPPNSEASIIFGKGVTTEKIGPQGGLVLAVEDIDAAREELLSRGIDVSEVFHYAGGPFNNTVPNPRVPGRDPEGRSYFSFVSFTDPDGNCWLVQEVTTRLLGREWKSTSKQGETLAELLHETSKKHGHFEKTHADHNWWDWYGQYMNARQAGSTQDEATVIANKYIETVLHVPPR